MDSKERRGGRTLISSSSGEIVGREGDADEYLPHMTECSSFSTFVAKSSYLFILILIFIFIYDFVLHYIVLCCLWMYLFWMIMLVLNMWRVVVWIESFIHSLGYN